MGGLALIHRIERGERAVRIADTVVFETAFTLEKTYCVPRPAIRDALLPLVALPGVVLPGKQRFGQVFDLYLAQPTRSFADCSHLVLTQRLRLPTILSFDQKRGRLPGVTREEP